MAITVANSRIETRTAMVSPDIEWLEKPHPWPSCRDLGAALRCLRPWREDELKTTGMTLVLGEHLRIGI
jgi:hypothetical protein